MALKGLKEEVDLILERKLAYEECIRTTTGFTPDRVRLEVSETGASMTISTEAGYFKVWTADGYSWFLDDVAFKPSSYDPSAWFDPKGIGELEIVLRRVADISGVFYRIREGELKVDLSEGGPFYASGQTVQLRLSEAVVQYNPGSKQGPADKNYMVAFVDNEADNIEADAQKLMDNLNARYKNLYGNKTDQK